MDFSYQHAQSQRVLRQRNMLGITAIVLAGIVGLLLLFSANRDREAVLLPILDGPLRVSSSGVTREYLELVTRDTAVLTLNRTPNSLDYWMKQVLAIVSPKSTTSPRAFGYCSRAPKTSCLSASPAAPNTTSKPK